MIQRGLHCNPLSQCSLKSLPVHHSPSCSYWSPITVLLVVMAFITDPFSVIAPHNSPPCSYGPPLQSSLLSWPPSQSFLQSWLPKHSTCFSHGPLFQCPFHSLPPLHWLSLAGQRQLSAFVYSPRCWRLGQKVGAAKLIMSTSRWLPTYLFEKSPALCPFLQLLPPPRRPWRRASILTGHRLVPVHSPGFGDPWSI